MLWHVERWCGIDRPWLITFCPSPPSPATSVSSPVAWRDIHKYLVNIHGDVRWGGLRAASVFDLLRYPVYLLALSLVSHECVFGLNTIASYELQCLQAEGQWKPLNFVMKFDKLRLSPSLTKDIFGRLKHCSDLKVWKKLSFQEAWLIRQC